MTLWKNSVSDTVLDFTNGINRAKVFKSKLMKKVTQNVITEAEASAERHDWLEENLHSSLTGPTGLLQSLETIAQPLDWVSCVKDPIAFPAPKNSFSYGFVDGQHRLGIYAVMFAIGHLSEPAYNMLSNASVPLYETDMYPTLLALDAVKKSSDSYTKEPDIVLVAPQFWLGLASMQTPIAKLQASLGSAKHITSNSAIGMDMVRNIIVRSPYEGGVFSDAQMVGFMNEILKDHKLQFFATIQDPSKRTALAFAKHFLKAFAYLKSGAAALSAFRGVPLTYQAKKGGKLEFDYLVKVLLHAGGDTTLPRNELIMLVCYEAVFFYSSAFGGAKKTAAQLVSAKDEAILRAGDALALMLTGLCDVETDSVHSMMQTTNTFAKAQFYEDPEKAVYVRLFKFWVEVGPFCFSTKNAVRKTLVPDIFLFCALICCPPNGSIILRNVGYPGYIYKSLNDANIVPLQSFAPEVWAKKADVPEYAENLSPAAQRRVSSLSFDKDIPNRFHIVTWLEASVRDGCLPEYLVSALAQFILADEDNQDVAVLQPWLQSVCAGSVTLQEKLLDKVWFKEDSSQLGSGKKASSKKALKTPSKSPAQSKKPAAMSSPVSTKEETKVSDTFEQWVLSKTITLTTLAGAGMKKEDEASIIRDSYALYGGDAAKHPWLDYPNLEDLLLTLVANLKENEATTPVLLGLCMEDWLLENEPVVNAFLEQENRKSKKKNSAKSKAALVSKKVVAPAVEKEAEEAVQSDEEEEEEEEDDDKESQSVFAEGISSKMLQNTAGRAGEGGKLRQHFHVVVSRSGYDQAGKEGHDRHILSTQNQFTAISMCNIQLAAKTHVVILGLPRMEEYGPGAPESMSEFIDQMLSKSSQMLEILNSSVSVVMFVGLETKEDRTRFFSSMAALWKVPLDSLCCEINFVIVACQENALLQRAVISVASICRSNGSSSDNPIQQLLSNYLRFRDPVSAQLLDIGMPLFCIFPSDRFLKVKKMETKANSLGYSIEMLLSMFNWASLEQLRGVISNLGNRHLQVFCCVPDLDVLAKGAQNAPFIRSEMIENKIDSVLLLDNIYRPARQLTGNGGGKEDQTIWQTIVVLHCNSLSYSVPDEDLKEAHFRYSPTIDTTSDSPCAAILPLMLDQCTAANRGDQELLPYNQPTNPALLYNYFKEPALIVVAAEIEEIAEIGGNGQEPAAKKPKPTELIVAEPAQEADNGAEEPQTKKRKKKKKNANNSNNSRK